MAVFIPLVFVGVFASMEASTALDNAMRERVVKGAGKLADLVQETLGQEIKFVTQLSLSGDAVTAAATGKVAAMDSILAELQNKFGQHYESVVILNASGVIVSDGIRGTSKGVSLAERDYFQKAKSGAVAIGSVVKSKISGNPIVTVCAPIMKDGSFVGAAAAIMKMDNLSEKITAKLGQTGYGFMVDKEGNFIAHPEKANVLTLNLKSLVGMEKISSQMMAAQSGVEKYVFKGTGKIAGFAPIALTGWSICLTQNDEEFLGAAHSIRNIIFLVTVIFLAVTVVGVFFFAKKISGAIQNAVVQMSEAATQVSAASSQVSAASQSLAEGSSEQASSIEETSSSLEEMSSMTKQNADNAGQADILMKQSKQIVERANSTLGSLTHSMKEISDASAETSKIIRTIDEIAFQTNLLALNAAVEAARAGEAGAGFAVVAEEVRNLAMRAADAARNTAGLIEGTVEKVKDGSELVAKTNEAFSEVSVSSGKVAELVGEIAAASREQSQGIDQINRAVSEMEKVTQMNAANAEESAAASEELNAQAEQMSQVSRILAEIVGGQTDGGDVSYRSARQDTLRPIASRPAMLTAKGTVKKALPHHFDSDAFEEAL